MGEFAVHLGIPPHRYWALLLEERDAIVDAWNRAKK